MPRITSIKLQKDKNRVNIYLDGEFGFGLDLENFVKFHLKVEQELTSKQISEIVKKSEHQKVLDRLLNFATLRPRSEDEIKSWLRRKKVSEDMHSPLFDTLNRLKLLDDYKFARWWVEQRNLFRPKGRKGLRFELLKKGISREIIEKVLEEVGPNEERVALEFLKKRSRKWERTKKEVLKQKMYELLARQGFGWDVAQKAVKEYNMSGDDKKIK